MLKVYKYPVTIDDYFSLDLPEGAKILTMQTQLGEPQIWVLVNPDNPTETRKFRIAGTGHPIQESEESLYYVGTFQELEGQLKCHLFEIRTS